MDNITLAAAKTMAKACVDEFNNTIDTRVTTVEEKMDKSLEPITVEEINSLFNE